MFNNKKILITGGTGSFGKAFVSMLVKKYKNIKKLIIFSRDEYKQYEMQLTFSREKYKFLRYFLGDVRDKDRLNFAFRDVDYIIHAAALKQVNTAEYNPFEFINTNILGAKNVIEASINCGVEKVIALSTDKACSPINHPGTVKTQGLELISYWKFNDLLNFDLNYTYTSSYDGAEQDDPNKSSGQTNAQLVRVPRNIINLSSNFKIPNYKNFDFTIKTKWSDMARDYGNGNRTFDDERLDDYLVSDLIARYNLWNTYNVNLSLTNILDEKYETVRDYSQHGRSFNIGIKRSF